jgi:hypothetical protein
MKTREKHSKYHFWVTNYSNRNVSLSDLNLTIPAFRTVNLMDTKHYQYTFKQLQKSAESGSLFLKKDKLFVRQDHPDVPESKQINLLSTEISLPINREAIIPSRERSTLVFKEEKYEELQITDEEFADENAEMANMDTQPLIIKKDNHAT